MTLRYTDRAAAELEAAITWYERRQEGLGLEFLDRVESSVHSITRNSEMYPIVYGNFRRCVIRQFPFSIFYTVEDESVTVHSLFNDRRHPRDLPEK